MKTMSKLIVLAAVVALGTGLAAAQITGEPMDGLTRNHATNGTGNVFACPTTGNQGSPACGIGYRFYGSDGGSNCAINPQTDGNPIYQAAVANGIYRSDIDNSANFYGAGHSAGVQMNLVWDGQLRGGTGDHAGYYGGSSQLITSNGETGNINVRNCNGTRAIACFGAVAGVAGDAPADTPQGTITQEGGMVGVPVPVVSGSTPAVNVTLSWADPLNDTVVDGAVSPIAGVNLYLLLDNSATPLNSRAITDVDLAGATLHGSFPTGTTSTVIDFASLPVGTTNFIPAIRVAYVDNCGSEAMESAWSANGPTVRVDPGLFTEVVNFKATYYGKAQGEHSAEISWETTAEDGTIGFTLFRSTSMNGDLTKVANLPAQGIGGEGIFYVQDDLFKVPGNVREVFYTLAVIESDGSDNAVGPIRMEIPKVTGPRK